MKDVVSRILNLLVFFFMIALIFTILFFSAFVGIEGNSTGDGIRVILESQGFFITLSLFITIVCYSKSEDLFQ